VKCNEHYIYFARLTLLGKYVFKKLGLSVVNDLLISLFSSVDLKTYTILTQLLQLINFLFLLKIVIRS